jgi:hypothetical protein
MGLLDEAIRDHLELKRRRGADPGEIAREEREALDPVFPDEPRSPALDDEPQPGPLLDEEPPQGDPLMDGGHAPADVAPAEPVPAAQPDAHEISTVGQETAELDMQAVLEQDARPLGAAAGPGGLVAKPDGAAEDELLGWEAPGAAGELPPQPLPGQESMDFE